MNKVTHSKKGNDGTILAIGSEGWTKFKPDVIAEIEKVGNRKSPYFVEVNGSKVLVHVINDSQKGKYLRTDPDRTTKNNLSSLPDC
jgi:hypothetical protein